MKVLDNGVVRDATPEEAAEIEARSVVDMAALKDAKNAKINEWRAAENLSTFTHLGKEIACDPLSRSDLDATANHISLFGTFPPDFPSAWKAVDNTYLPMTDIAAFKDMYSSMTARGSANFIRSQDRKAALAAAITPAEVNAIVW